jgi:hypothetical protein
MVRREVFKQLIKFTHILERMGRNNQMRGIQTVNQVHIHHQSYHQAGEDGGIIRCVLKIIDQVHILSGDG